jgi:uncharacterized membrane protein
VRGIAGIFGKSWFVCLILYVIVFNLSRLDRDSAWYLRRWL